MITKIVASAAVLVFASAGIASSDGVRDTLHDAIDTMTGGHCLLPADGVRLPTGRSNEDGDDIRDSCQRPGERWGIQLDLDLEARGFANGPELLRWCAEVDQDRYSRYHDPFRACQWDNAVQASWIDHAAHGTA